MPNEVVDETPTTGLDGFAGRVLLHCCGCVLLACAPIDGFRSFRIDSEKATVPTIIIHATGRNDSCTQQHEGPHHWDNMAHTLETDGYEESVYSDATVEAAFRGLACT